MEVSPFTALTPAFAAGLKRSGKPVRQHALVSCDLAPTLSHGCFPGPDCVHTRFYGKALKPMTCRLGG